MQLESFLESSARQRPDKIAIVAGNRRWSYAQLEASANRLAHALQAEGVERGDRVAVWLDNGVEAVAAIFAILKAGAVLVMVNPTTKADKLRFLLNHSRAAALFAPASKVAGLVETVGITGSAVGVRSKVGAVVDDTRRVVFVSANGVTVAAGAHPASAASASSIAMEKPRT